MGCCYPKEQCSFSVRLKLSHPQNSILTWEDILGITIEISVLHLLQMSVHFLKFELKLSNLL